MDKLMGFLTGVKRDEPLDEKKIHKRVLIAAAIGCVIWGGFALAAAAMLVSFGAWAWVVYPFALYWWAGHVARALKVYTDFVKPKPKVEQNVTFNVNSDLTTEQIAAAAERAAKVHLTYGM
jgi:hypothetical protein